MIAQILGAAVAMGVTLAGGQVLLKLGWPASARGFAERWSLAFLLGSGVGAWAAWWAEPLTAFVGIRGQLLVASSVGGLSLIAWARATGVDVREQKRPRVRRITVALTALLMAVVAVSIALAIGVPNATRGLSEFDAAALQPPLLPMLGDWLHLWTGESQPQTLRTLSAAFWLCLVGLFFGAVRRETTSPVALASCIGLAVVPAFVLGPGSSSSGAPDVPLAAYTLGATMCARRALEDAGFGQATLAAVLSACAAWTRPDGIAFALIVAAMFTVSAAIRANQRRGAASEWKLKSVLLTVVPLAAVMPWWLSLSSSGVGAGSAFELGVAWTSSPASRSIVEEVLSLQRWTALWPAFALTTLIYAARLRRPGELLSTGVVVLTVLIYVLAVARRGAGMAEALPHFLLPIAPIALLVTIGHLRAAVGRRAVGVEQPT